MAVAVVVVGIISPPPVTPVVVMMASVGSSLLLTSLVDSRSLSNAVVVAFPNDVGGLLTVHSNGYMDFLNAP